MEVRIFAISILHSASAFCTKRVDSTNPWRSGARPYLIGQLVGTLLHVRELVAHVCVICHGCCGEVGGADLQLGSVSPTGRLGRAGGIWDREIEKKNRSYDWSCRITVY